MLTKAIGLLMILVGIVLGVSLLLPLLVGSLMLVWYLLKLAVMLIVVYIGYRVLLAGSANRV